MPSPRRLRLIALGVIVTIVFIVYYSHHDSAQGNSGLKDFYHRTKDAMDGQTPSDKSGSSGSGGLRPADRDKDGDIDVDDEIIGAEMQERLKAAESKAKELANEKAGLRPDAPSKINGIGSSADGQQPDSGSSKQEVEVSEEARDTEAELNLILKKSPGHYLRQHIGIIANALLVIIFSKSYCPHSKEAKDVLLNKYTIEPAPFVVELDKHELGPQLQDALKDKTGRRTVPNVLINGVSIGGGDEVVELHETGALVSKLEDLGAKRLKASPV